MEELRLWIKDVGFPIACACASMWAVFALFKLREADRHDKDSKIAESLDENTKATKEQTAWWKGFGPDPFKAICKAPPEHICKAPPPEKIDKLIKLLEDKTILLAVTAKEGEPPARPL